jgi:hypothetical protein
MQEHVVVGLGLSVVAVAIGLWMVLLWQGRIRLGRPDSQLNRSYLLLGGIVMFFCLGLIIAFGDNMTGPVGETIGFTLATFAVLGGLATPILMVWRPERLRPRWHHDPTIPQRSLWPTKPMLETWKQTFLTQGSVEVRTRRATTLFLIVGGVGFTAVSLYTLAVPSRSAALQMLGPWVQLLVGVAGLALGLGGTLAGLRSLHTPLLVVRLDHAGVTLPMRALIPWEQVTGAKTFLAAGQHVVVICTTGEHNAEALAARGWRGRLERAADAFVEPGDVPLRTGAPGDREELRDLITWARELHRSPA